MTTLIRTTADGRKVEVIGLYICLDGKKEAEGLIPLGQHPNREAVINIVPEARYMAGRLPLTEAEAAIAGAALEAARIEYENSPKGLAERMRKTQNHALANRDG
jgi:hypothetical protein